MVFVQQIAVPQSTVDVLVGATIALLSTFAFERYKQYREITGLRNALLEELEDNYLLLTWVADAISYYKMTDDERSSADLEIWSLWKTTNLLSSVPVEERIRSFKTIASDADLLKRYLEDGLVLSSLIYESNSNKIGQLSDDEIAKLIYSYRTLDILNNLITTNKGADLDFLILQTEQWIIGSTTRLKTAQDALESRRRIEI